MLNLRIANEIIVSCFPSHKRIFRPLQLGENYDNSHNLDGTNIKNNFETDIVWVINCDIENLLLLLFIDTIHQSFLRNKTKTITKNKHKSNHFRTPYIRDDEN